MQSHGASRNHEWSCLTNSSKTSGSTTPTTSRSAPSPSTPGRVTLHATTTSRSATCPSCGAVSVSVHSRYLRRLDEAAAAGRRVVVELQVQRFRCREPACPKTTFVEQVPGLTFRHGRRSQGLQAAMQRVALMLAGRAGARLTDGWPLR
ncbi:transposase family protein [Streptomyces virginiae]|uniref:transposase family protein n=1 Tax=Streptomyces virginiae TaxID=1961 RepID=UPI00343714A0